MIASAKSFQMDIMKKSGGTGLICRLRPENNFTNSKAVFHMAAQTPMRGISSLHGRFAVGKFIIERNDF